MIVFIKLKKYYKFYIKNNSFNIKFDFSKSFANTTSTKFVCSNANGNAPVPAHKSIIFNFFYFLILFLYLITFFTSGTVGSLDDFVR